MKTVSVNTLKFIDSWVADEICKKYNFNELVAFRDFINSKTYKMLIDYETELYLLSPKIIFDLWETEKITGDPKNSIYIRA